MDDINFDELDQAVNSVLGKSTGDAQQPGPAQDETPHQDTAPHETSPVAAVPVTPAVAVPTAQSSQPSVVQKRRGQFMDMVHPSSDMTGVKQPQDVAAKMNRQALTVQPLHPSVVDAAQPVVPPQDAIREQEEPVPMYGGAPKTEYAVHSEWPDPLDSMDQTAHDDGARETAYTSNVEPEDDSMTVVDNSTDEAPQQNPATQSAQTSPFVGGAEVEKRPLGAFAGQPQEADEGMLMPSSTHDEPQEPPVVSLPQELAPEVVSVESDNPENIPDDSAPVEEPLEQTVSEATTAAVSSIPQQYHTPEAGPDDHEMHPVFDTNEYHQPLEPPAKRKHPVLVALLLILLLVILGAVGGYLVWTLKLI